MSNLDFTPLDPGIYQALQSQCWPGRRIVCILMPDVPEINGRHGTVRYVDEFGFIHITWDDWIGAQPCINAILDQWYWEGEERFEKGAGAQKQAPQIVLL